ncbi:MAG TPA: ATP-binding protein [Anaeromyxobacteraceae bacterium]|nr:ATP-binding protein [Anaeromyxobacteraceae bacterium]
MRFPVRFQILALVAAVVIAALASYFVLATRLFTRDKLAYIYDLESSLTAMVSEELRESLSSRIDKLGYFALVARDGDPERAARHLLASDPDLLSLEIWEPRGGRPERIFARAERERLAAANLTEADLAEARRTTPVAFDALEAEGALLQNASLPPDLALLSLAAIPPGGRAAVVAVLRPDRMLRIFARSPAWRVYLVDGRGTLVVHPDPSRMVARADASSSEIVREATRGALARGVREFEGEEGPAIGAFARVGVGRLAVVAEVPRAEALRASRALGRRSVLFGLAVLFVAILASVGLGLRLTSPLRRLEAATEAIARGDFATRVPERWHGEIGALARAFNRMGGELAEREARLGEAHAQLAQSAKLSAVGELAASVVHEVKNPIAGLVGYAEVGAQATTLGEAKETFRIIEKNAWRAADVLQTMLAFARPADVSRGPVDLSRLVHDTLRLVQHQLQLSGVSVRLDLPAGLPRVRGNEQQLQQVLVNLVMNAAHAMEAADRRVLDLSTRAEGDRVVLAVRDTGVGMTAETRARLFTPFFTTKAPGQGTGLGLSVTRRIVEEHGGTIGVDSEPGRGAAFEVRIPAEAA